MNFKKIFAGFAAASVAVSAMAVSAFAEKVKLDDVAKDWYGEGIFDFLYDITSSDGPDFEALMPEDVITISLESESDTSFWMIGLLGYDADLAGFEGALGDLGEMTLSVTVQELMDANGFTYEEIYGVALEVLGPTDEDIYDIHVTITGESAEETGSAEEPSDGTDNTAQPADGNGDTTGASDPDKDKDNADTGIEGVAVVAGLAVVAAGAVVVARKRK